MLDGSTKYWFHERLMKYTQASDKFDQEKREKI